MTRSLPGLIWPSTHLQLGEQRKGERREGKENASSPDLAHSRHVLCPVCQLTRFDRTRNEADVIKLKLRHSSL